LRRQIGNLIGSWAFLIGVILAIILGAFGLMTPTLIIVLIVIGLIVGFFNISARESEPFLISGIALIIASAFGQAIVQDVAVLSSMLQSMLLIFVPATIIVAIRNVFTLSRD
jgi:uncharacterized membrane protein